MKDFPVFSTETGVSSLILKEVPYRETAYIHIQDVQPDGFGVHLKECVSFCRMVGAEKVYAAGCDELVEYPTYMQLLEMRGEAPQKNEVQKKRRRTRESTRHH